MKTGIKCTLLFIFTALVLLSCKNNKNNFNGFTDDLDGDIGNVFSDLESLGIGELNKYLKEDCVENYSPFETVEISFSGKNAFVNGKEATEKGITVFEDSDGKKLTVSLQNNVSGDDSEAEGIIVEYKGENILKYILSGNLDGTLKIKNKNADCIVELSGLNIKSSVTGPALHFTSENYRTFIVVKEGTSNTFIDNRILNQQQEMMNDKKGSIYAKGALIFSGSTFAEKGGKLSVINRGYKNGIYSHDYIRIKNIDLDVLCEGETSRDCIRTLNAVIIDDGIINLKSNGTLRDDEGCGIKVEGEDADEDKLSVEYTSGAGFIVINGGTLTSDTTSKGITAHWKSAKTVIGNENYSAKKNTSLLFGTSIINSDAEKPEPYLIINGGDIDITTTLQPYENSDASCSPEGLEAKSDLIINGGKIKINSTDDAVNAGGSIVINGGTIYANSSFCDGFDANGSNGIMINGGTIFVSGINVPECAFDCDQNPFTVNGGILVGFGSGNITMPSSLSKQNIFVIGAMDYAGKTLAIKQNGKIVFACNVPSRSGETMILSSPRISKDGYEICTNGIINGTDFNGLYTSLEKYSGGEQVASGTVSESVTKINVTTGFGGGGFDGGRTRGNRPDDFGDRSSRKFGDGMNPPSDMPPRDFGRGNRPERTRNFDDENPPPKIPENN